MKLVERGAIGERSPAWYAIYTKHQHEKAASELLVRKGFEVLLPLYRTVHKWRDRNKTIYLPLFPCYLFVHTSLARKLEILRTPGVFWLLESGGHACPVPDHDIEAVIKIINSSSQAEPHPYLKTGDRVRISHGALAGIEGILSRFKNKYRVILNVELLQSAVAVEVDLPDLEQSPLSRPRASLAFHST